MGLEVCDFILFVYIFYQVNFGQTKCWISVSTDRFLHSSITWIKNLAELIKTKKKCMLIAPREDLILAS